MSSHRVWKRRAGLDLKVTQTGIRTNYLPITAPPIDIETIKATSDRITLTSFSPTDAWTLGHILFSLLSPLASPSPSEANLQPSQPCVISISTGQSHILFQTVTGPGTLPDHQTWVDRKRRSVLRWGCSTWLLGRKYEGDEEKFRKKFGMGEEEGGRYAIHGGGVPIYVEGVEGVAGVVVVSGLKQSEDHAVIFDAIREGWE